MTQTELMRESFRHNQEMNELLQKQEELQERLSEEARAREQLALELHRAEGEFFSFWIYCLQLLQAIFFNATGRNSVTVTLWALQLMMCAFMSE